MRADSDYKQCIHIPHRRTIKKYFRNWHSSGALNSLRFISDIFVNSVWKVATVGRGSTAAQQVHHKLALRQSSCRSCNVAYAQYISQPVGRMRVVHALWDSLIKFPLPRPPLHAACHADYTICGWPKMQSKRLGVNQKKRYKNNQIKLIIMSQRQRQRQRRGQQLQLRCREKARGRGSSMARIVSPGVE